MDLGAKAKAKGKYLFVWGKEAATYYQTLAIDSAIKEGGDEVRLALENLEAELLVAAGHPGRLHRDGRDRQGRLLRSPAARAPSSPLRRPSGATTRTALLYPSGSWIENEMKKATKADFKMTGVPEMTVTSELEDAVRGAAQRGRRAVHRPVARARTSAGGKELLRAMLSKEAATNFAKTKLAPTIVKGTVPADGFGSTALVIADQDARRRRHERLRLQVRRPVRHEHRPAGRLELVPVRADRRRRR